MSAGSKVRTPIGSNSRTKGQSSRTGIEPGVSPRTLKALAQRVLQSSSKSDPSSNVRRTEQFEQGSNRPIPIEPKFESKSSPALPMSDPTEPCPDCGSGQWWPLPGDPWHCRACKPDMPLMATTLTPLPYHKVELRPVAARAELRTRFETACQELSITPEQLH